ncbi:MAG TPA: hypothetical protein VEK57_13960 [Thermoanaerobaculia bacterium]|nr:hypothetical protein [Thermoanaerobaculia bacterium]
MNVRRQRLWIIAALAGVLLAGCRNRQDEQFDVIIVDTANVLSDDTENWLRTFKYPKGLPLVVTTESRISTAIVGAVADARFKAIARQHPQKDVFEDRGVLLVASETPALIQIRVGREIHSLARWRGITAGEPYLRQQLATRHQNVNDGIRTMVAWTAAELPSAVELPWQRRWLMFEIVQTLGAELDELSVPSEGFYSAFLLKPISTVRVMERNRFGSWWMTYVLIGIACYLLKALLALLLVNPLRRRRPAIGNAVALVLAIAIGLGLAVPSAGSAVLLAGSRLEDQLALRASGLPGVDELTFAPGTFVRTTDVWIAILLFLLRIMKGFADRSWLAGFAGLADEQQRELFTRLKKVNPLLAFLLEAIGSRTGKSIELSEDDYLRSPYTNSYFMPVVDDIWAGVRWGLLAAFFLPMGLSLAAMYFWLVPIATGLFGTAKAVWARDAVAQRLAGHA